MGGPHPAVGLPCPVLDPLGRYPAVQLQPGLEGAGRHSAFPGRRVHLQQQQRPLQVGRQPPAGRGRRGRRRLDLRGGHQPQSGGGKARGRCALSARRRRVESVPGRRARVSAVPGWGPTGSCVEANSRLTNWTLLSNTCSEITLGFIDESVFFLFILQIINFYIKKQIKITLAIPGILKCVGG